MLQKLTWKDVREEVAALNPDLAAAIDAVSPDDKHCLYKVKYAYGDEIIKKGRLQLPTKLGLTDLNDPSIDPEIQKALGYNLGSNPVTFMLKGSLELFCAQEKTTLPLGGLIPPGAFFGLFRVLSDAQYSHQAKFIWGMTSGARSLFMLPKVAEREKYKRLKKAFKLTFDKPKGLIDHWNIFREIANHSSFDEPWESEMLFFSKEWFEHFEDDAWQSFCYFLYRRTWMRNDFFRNQFVWNLIFSIVQKEANLRSNTYVADTVKGLFSIAVGGAPGFIAASDNTAGPIRGLQEAYYNVYGVKNYQPVIMRPARFDLLAEETQPVYYSLQFPTAMEFGPKSSKHTSILTDLYDVQTVLGKTLRVLRNREFNIEGTPLNVAVEQTEFDFYHNNTGIYKTIKDSGLLPQEDPLINTCALEGLDLEFAAAAAFVKGCIKISKVQKNTSTEP